MLSAASTRQIASTGAAEPCVEIDSRSPVAPPQPQRRIKVIYIAGYGRSGTTLVDIALGEHAAIMGGGEIATLARHVWANAEYCACGEKVPDCQLWGDIVTDWAKNEAPTLIPEYRDAQVRTEAILGVGRMIERFGSRRHGTRTVALFERIAHHSGRSIIVDSSKLPGRALALADLRGIELYVVHVVRDARGVAWSLSKRHARRADRGLQRELRPKPLTYTALRWAIVNLATEWLRLRVGARHSLRVRYEDFVTDPGKVLAGITQMVGAPSSPHIGKVAMTPQHQMAGSRHRMQPQIVINRDERWRQEMPRWKQRWVSLICAPLLWIYGYPMTPDILEEQR